MANIGAQPGNDNYRKGKIVSEAIRKHIVQNPEKLDSLVKAQVVAAANGDLAAAMFIRDTLDGKPHQSSDVSISGNLQDALASIQAIPVPGDTDAT
jgi:hypothetical protein